MVNGGHLKDERSQGRIVCKEREIDDVGDGDFSRQGKKRKRSRAQVAGLAISMRDASSVVTAYKADAGA